MYFVYTTLFSGRGAVLAVHSVLLSESEVALAQEHLPSLQSENFRTTELT